MSVLVSLLFIELAFRLADGKPALAFSDWRRERILLNRIGARRAVPDPMLGWTVKPWFEGDLYTSIDHGIRSNFGERIVRTGGILAVGDSFTEGWDVHNNESWPAHLEKLTGMPVVNGGVFGYATDQIMLRAEQLLPIVQPKVLIVGFIDYDIFRSAHSDFGAPKPHFTIENGGLHFHPPRPIDVNAEGGPVARAGLWLRDALGYSAAANFLLGRLAPEYWYSGARILYRRVEVDPVAITCALLERMKAHTKLSDIRMLLFMQYNEFQILAGDQLPENARHVIECAKAVGIEVVDQFASLRVMAVTSPDVFRAHYFREQTGFGHMTETGNKHAAGLLAEALAGERQVYRSP